MSVLNIRSVVDVQSVITSTTPDRRDFRNLLFVYKGEEYNSTRTNSFTSYADVVDAYGSNSEPAKASLSFFQGGFNSIKPTRFMVANSASGEVWADVVSELIADPRYVTIACDNTFSDEDKETLADAIEASTKIKYIGCFLDTTTTAKSQDLTTDTTSLAKTFYTNAYGSNYIVYDDVANKDEYKNIAMASYFSTVNFTSSRPLGQLAFKQFSGQTASTLTDTNFDNLVAKNCNLYGAFGEVGRNIAYKGVMANGTFIDTVLGGYWLDYNVTYNIFDLLTTLPKLAYTTSDFNKLYSVIASAMEQAREFGLIAGGVDADTGVAYPKGYDIYIPAPEDVSKTDKQAGVLEDIVVTALLGGNIIKITLTNYLKL